MQQSTVTKPNPNTIEVIEGMPAKLTNMKQMYKKTLKSILKK